MIGRVIRLFHRYVARHGRIDWLGFSLIDARGQSFGHLDRISMTEGRLQVEGWALSPMVGLASVEAAQETVPSLRREDVQNHLGEHANGATSGFSLTLLAGGARTVFWASHGGERYVFALPRPGARELRLMRLRQIGPFLRDGLRALPAALHWLARRDALSAAWVKTILGLNTVPRATGLNVFLFTEDVQSLRTAPTALAETEITLVIPVYNAFDLLPEVLDRVLTNTDLPWQLILVEDCSSDAQVRPWLRRWRSGLTAEMRERIILLENEQNLGFIRSVNRAFAAAISMGHHVVLLNSDAFVPEGWASRLIRPFLELANIATVTPLSNDAEIFNVPVIVERAPLEPGQADAIDRVARLFDPGIALADAPTGVGFCMAMHIDHLRALPEFDTGFGRGYGEEVDWCQRARRAGGRHLGLAGLFVEHRGGTSFGSEEKLKLVRKNNETISRRYPGYDREVQEFIRDDPLATPRLALALAWAGTSQKGRVPVYLAHDMSGGAENYLQGRLAQDLERDAAAVVLRVGGLSRWQIELHSVYGVTRGESDDAGFVRRLLELLPARDVIYSCGVGDRDPISLPERLLELVQGPEDRLEVLFHDFLPLSPSYTLLGADGTYRGVPAATDNRDPAHETQRADGGRASLADWRTSWGRLMTAADRIVVFSENSRAIVAEAYPEVGEQIVVTPHKLLTEVPEVKPGRAPDGLPVIGVLGNIGYQKGAAVLRDMSQTLSRTGRARLVVVGNVDPAYPLAAPGLVHGDYRVADIPGLVQRYGISHWLIPSIWPETFSYATNEVLATGIPVWSFDLGAQGAAVAAAAERRGQGGVIAVPLTAREASAVADIILDGP